MIREKLFEYGDRFDENFPMFLFRSTPEEEVIRIIDKCIENGKPYEEPDSYDPEAALY